MPTPQLIFIGIGFSEPDKDMETYQARNHVPTGHHMQNRCRTKLH